MDDLAIILDARSLRTYPVAGAGFHGGTESLVRILAEGLAKRGHEVHVIAPDAQHMEHRAPTEFWWPERNHPDIADVVIAVHSLETVGDLSAPMLVMLPNGIDPPLYDKADVVDAFATFSQTHTDMLARRMGIAPERCFVTGLGVDLEDYSAINQYVYDAFWKVGSKTKHPFTVPGRMLYGNDPARGLWHLLDIYDRVKAGYPDASLHVTYDFDRQFEQHRWQATALAEQMWECKRRLAATPGIVSLGALSHADMLREQMECHVHVMPSDPPNQGSQIHGLLQMELAAAGVPLVLSDIEAFPEVFPEATHLPLPGVPRKFDSQNRLVGRVDAQDWADVTVELMRSPKKWKAASKASRAMAEANDWTACLDRWETLLGSLVARLQGEQAAA